MLHLKKILTWAGEHRNRRGCRNLKNWCELSQSGEGRQLRVADVIRLVRSSILSALRVRLSVIKQLWGQNYFNYHGHDLGIVPGIRFSSLSALDLPGCRLYQFSSAPGLWYPNDELWPAFWETADHTEEHSPELSAWRAAAECYLISSYRNSSKRSKNTHQSTLHHSTLLWNWEKKR